MSNYRGRGRGRGGFGGGSKLKGKFENNTWYCDCSPKLPADHFKVRKEGPNKGRWFYTCQKKEDERCGFFLWDDDAKPREKAAVLSNSGDEPAPSATLAPPTPSTRPRSVANGPKTSPPPAYDTATKSSSSTAAKRKFQEEVDGDETEDEDEDDYGWTPDFSVEAAIGKALDNSHNTMPPPVTPRKALKGNAYSTPGGNGMITPVSHHRSNGAGPSSSTSADVTPTPGRFTSTTPSGGESDVSSDSLVPEVMHLLTERGVSLDADASEALQKVLKNHTLRLQGVARGRDISRLAVRERNAKIGELQARIAALEAELETQKAVISNLNWQKETGQWD